MLLPLLRVLLLGKCTETAAWFKFEWYNFEMKRKPIRILPAVELLRSLLDYDPVTGSLRWKSKSATSHLNKIFNSKYAGKAAGSMSAGRAHGDNKYLVVGVRDAGRYQQFPAHRIIWKIVTGEEPPPLIDHKDGDAVNMKWNNLRAATNGQNIRNAKLRSDNISGVKGVSWDSGHKKWRAIISIDKRYVRLGRYDTIAQARAVIELEREKMHGEFARHQ